MRRAVPAAGFPGTGVRALLVVFAAAPVALTLAMEPALAQRPNSAFNNDNHRAVAEARHPASSVQGLRAPREVGRSAEKKQKTGTAGSEAKGPARPLFAVVSLADQRISIYNHDGLVTRSVVSTGMAGHRTPAGIFSIIGRSRHHRSNIYSGAPMPFMQRITWSGVAMHQGVVPGFPASHGCIRLPAKFAAHLWGLTRIGDRVVISPRETVPRAFAHSLLPAPKMQPDPTGSSAPPMPALVSETHSGAPVTPVAVTTRDVQSTASTHPEPKLLNPMEFAAAFKAKVAADKAAAARGVQSAFETASAKTADARRAVAEVKDAKAQLAAAEGKLTAAVKALEDAAPEKKAHAEADKAAADGALTDAAKKLEEAKAAEALISPEAFAAVQAWKDANAAIGTAESILKDAARRASPISVLVSKKDQRVYVRQGLVPVRDAPASVRGPEAPLGTHVFIASAVDADGASLKWSVISIPVAEAASNKGGTKLARKSPRSESPEAAAAPVNRPPSSPAEALERIEIPEEIRDLISKRLWTGGSLIVTDRPLSGETSDSGTDLVVTMR